MNKLSQFFNEYRGNASSSEMTMPIKQHSMMQNFRKNFIDEIPVELTLPARGNNIYQKRISEYFPEVKTLDHQTLTQRTKRKKRSLQELQMKYDSVQNMVANLSKSSQAENISERTLLTKIKKNKSRAYDEKNCNDRSFPSQKKVKNENEPNEKPTFIHLVGKVDNVLRWSHILRETKIYVTYNVLGYFISAMDGIYEREKFVFIRNDKSAGIILECSYFEIDRPLPQIRKDQFVGCHGHLIGAQRFRLFSIDVLKDSDISSVQRAFFLSQRSTHELSNRKFD